MNEIIKFPKERYAYINLTNELFYKKNYPAIINISEKLWDNFDSIENSNIFDILIIAYFELGKFEDVIKTYKRLQVVQAESFISLYYTIASLISSKRIYQARKLIKNTALLSKEFHFENKNTNKYCCFDNNIIQEEYHILTLILINYIDDLSRDSLPAKLTMQFLRNKFYDLIELSLEIGFESKTIMALNDLRKKVFLIN